MNDSVHALSDGKHPIQVCLQSVSIKLTHPAGRILSCYWSANGSMVVYEKKKIIVLSTENSD